MLEASEGRNQLWLIEFLKYPQYETVEGKKVDTSCYGFWSRWRANTGRSSTYSICNFRNIFENHLKFIEGEYLGSNVDTDTGNPEESKKSDETFLEDR